MFNDVFSELRKEKGVFQKDIAQLFNLNPATISAWEVGKSEPDLTTLLKLADYFQCSTDYLLGRADEFDCVKIQNEMTKDEKEILKFYRESGNAGKKCIYIYSSGIYAAHKESLKL